MPILALYSPRPQCGKSTFADHLINRHSYIRLPFADPMKKMLEALFREVGISADDSFRYLYGDWKEKPIPQLGGKTTRFLMQTLGSEWGRDTVDEDFWVGVMEAKLSRYSTYDRIVIDDMRFPNEYKMLKRLGATFVKVIRPIDSLSTCATGHQSEGRLDQHPDVEFDSVVLNDHDVPWLQAKADSVASQLLNRDKHLYY